MIPSVSITKTDGNTGVVKPSADGILAIIAPSEKGTLNQPGAYARQDLAQNDFGYGPLVEYAAYVMSVARKPVVLIRCAASTAATNGTVTHTGAGTSVVTATGTPLDDFDVVITIVTGGTIGVAGITYTYSLDGGKTTSGVQALGTSTTITIPNSGVVASCAAGTLLAGQVEAFSTKHARVTSGDLTTALEALRTYGGSWEAILVCAEADATMISALDLWLSAREGDGKYRSAVLNSVFRTSAQSEAQYLTAMTTAFGASSSTRLVVCGDAGDLASAVRGIRQRRPVALGLAARGMLIDVARDAAYVVDGPIQGFSITDDRLNPKYHDEALFPGLDDIRLASMRSIAGREGAFINNPLLLSPSGSDYVYWQHTRVMNKACEIAFQLLTGVLSRGVRKDNTTGYILEEEAQNIEGLVNAELEKQLKKPGRVSDVAFVLSRTDDLSSNAGATLNGQLEVSALAYVKKFAVNSKFTKKITVQQTAT